MHSQGLFFVDFLLLTVTISFRCKVIVHGRNRQTYSSSVAYTSLLVIYTVFQKKTSTHIIGYKLRNSCLILTIFGNKIPHII